MAVKSMETKRPDAQKCLEKSMYGRSDEDINKWSLMAMLFALCGLFFKMKLASWTSVFFALGSWSHHRASESEFQQTIMTSLLCIMSIAVHYTLTPQA